MEIIKLDVSFGADAKPGPKPGAKPREEPESVAEFARNLKPDADASSWSRRT